MADAHPNRVVVLGGGLAGLSCGLHLAEAGVDVSVHEREAAAGGKATSVTVEGFSFDVTGHWLHLRDPEMQALANRLLPGEWMEVERRARVLSHGVMTRYPFQANTYGLPPAVVKECLLGFFDAVRQQEAGAAPPDNFYEYILLHFGEGIARHFMVPYNQKMWGVHPREITAAWCSRFVPRPTLEEVVAGAVGAHAEGLGYNPRFLYPVSGGIGRLAAAFGHALGPALHLSHAATSIDWRQRRVRFADGDERGYEHLVSSLPLPQLVERLQDVPESVTEAAARLRWTTVAYVNYGCRGTVNRGFHWVYVPEERFPFYRVGSYSNAAPHLAPDGHGSLYVEMTVPSPEVDWEMLLPDVRRGLTEAGLIPSEDVIVVEDPRVVPVAYVVFDHDCYAARKTIFEFLDSASVRSIGRYGRWTYGSMEDAMVDGRKTALEIMSP